MKQFYLSKFLAFILITFSFSYVMLSYCDCECTICFYIDNEDCNISESELANANMRVIVYQWAVDEYGPIPVPIADLTGPTSYETVRKVSGYEINYGFWSKDSYREYTWEEMFEWKYGRPPTQQESANITEQQVKDWFIERHTVERWWPLPDDPPRDVRTFEKPKWKTCTTWYDNCQYMFSGYIYFSDGTKCELETKDMWLRNGDCPAYIPMKVDPNCHKCSL
jgi:hypothetical protein